MKDFKIVVILLAVLPTAASGEPAATIIPIEIERGNVFTDARINGLEVRLGIDTGGARFLRLDPDTVTALAVPTEVSSEPRTNAYGISKETRNLTVETMKLGGRIFTNISTFTVPDTSSVPGDPPAWWPESDGTIGREFLKQFFVVIDYPRLSVALYDYGKEPEGHPCNGPRAPLVDHVEGIIVTEVELDHGPVTAIWDTGASHSFVREEVVLDGVLAAADQQEQEIFYKSLMFGVGGYDYGPLELVALPLKEPKGVHVFVGYNFFAQRAVCIDYRNGWLGIEGM